MTGAMWAVTVYFNPMGYRRRRDNYRLFRSYLRLPLITIELAYEDTFQLGPDAAEILVQIRGRDVLWQKERLLNHALHLLPPECQTVVCVDCDVIFESDDWPERTAELLDRFLMVQPFSRLNRTAPDWEPSRTRPAGAEVLRTPASLLASGTSIADCMGTPAEQFKCSTGTAWAMSRTFLERHRFYDACIIGGGDSAFVRAAYGRFDDAVRLQHMNDRRRMHYMAWARPFYEAVGGSVASLEGDLLHLWHGTPQDRRYRRRTEELEPFAFDPYEDIALDENGAWRWSSDKPDMHAFVHGYFAARREDG